MKEPGYIIQDENSGSVYEGPQVVQEWLDSLNELDVKVKKDVRLQFRESL